MRSASCGLGRVRSDRLTWRGRYAVVAALAGPRPALLPLVSAFTASVASAQVRDDEPAPVTLLVRLAPGLSADDQAAVIARGDGGVDAVCDRAVVTARSQR